MSNGETETAIESQLKHLKSDTTGVQTARARRLKQSRHLLSHGCRAGGSQGDMTSLHLTGHSWHGERRPEAGGSRSLPQGRWECTPP